MTPVLLHPLHATIVATLLAAGFPCSRESALIPNGWTTGPEVWLVGGPPTPTVGGAPLAEIDPLQHRCLDFYHAALLGAGFAVARRATGWGGTLLLVRDPLAAWDAEGHANG